MIRGIHHPSLSVADMQSMLGFTDPAAEVRILTAENPMALPGAR